MTWPISAGRIGRIANTPFSAAVVASMLNRTLDLPARPASRADTVVENQAFWYDNVEKEPRSLLTLPPLRADAGSARGLDDTLEAKLLRGAEAATIEKGEKISFSPVDLGSDVLDPKRHQIDQQLRHECATDPEIPVVRIDTDGVHDRRRVDPPEFAEINARHDEADHGAVALGHERHPNVRFVQRFGELAFEIGGPVPAGNATVNCDQRPQIAFDHGTYRHAVAC